MKVLLATSKPFAAQAVQKIQNIIESAGHVFTKLENYTNKTELLDVVKGGGCGHHPKRYNRSGSDGCSP